MIMGKVIVALTVSLDGFIAGANDGPDQGLGEGGMRLFDWYFTGDAPVRPYEEAARRGVQVPPFRLDRRNLEVFEELIDCGGAFVTGRRTENISGPGGGHGPLPGLPLFVVTHHVPDEVPRGESDYTFVTDGVESAIRQAKAVAGDRYVSLMGASIPQQALRAGLVDEILVHLVPVLLGTGVRLFDHLGADNIELETLRVVGGPGVTHLRYRVLE
jgi:dihydrofolate reductase